MRWRLRENEVEEDFEADYKKIYGVFGVWANREFGIKPSVMTF